MCLYTWGLLSFQLCMYSGVPNCVNLIVCVIVSILVCVVEPEK